MSGATCQWHRGHRNRTPCHRPVMGQGYCDDLHYWKLRRAGRLTTTLVDAAATQATIRHHLDSDRGLRDLAAASGVGLSTLYRIRDAKPGDRVQGHVARRIQATGPQQARGWRREQGTHH